MLQDACASYKNAYMSLDVLPMLNTDLNACSFDTRLNSVHNTNSGTDDKAHYSDSHDVVARQRTTADAVESEQIIASRALRMLTRRRP